MKSLPSSNRGASPKHIGAWTLPELGIESSQPAQDGEMEQILALFQNSQKDASAERGSRDRSGLLSAEARSIVSAWKPQEMDVQLPSAGSNEWIFVESSNDLYQNQEKEGWEELDPSQEAAAILKRARTQADEIILQARATAEKTILQADDEIERRKEAGFERGMNDARNEIADTLKTAHVLVEEIRGWQTSLARQGEQILVEMVKEVAQAMFGEGVGLDAGALQTNLNRIMESAQGLGDLNIFLNPRDARLLDPSWTEYQLLISGNKVRIVPSEKIKPGGCVVKGNTGTVDARVETQLGAILNTLDEVQSSTGG